MPLISDWGHLRTHGAPRISRKLPTPDLAFHAGAVTATECYDLASRVQRPWTESNFQPYRSPAGPGLFQFTSAQTAVRNGATRDLDTTNFVTVYTVWVEFLGAATSPQALYFYEGTVGNRVRLQWNTNGFQIGSYGGLTTPITLLAKADVKRGLNTVVMACSDNTGKIYLNGALIYTATTAQAWAAAQTELRIFNSTGSGSESIVPVLQGATWTGFYDQFAEYLSQRPENLFEPRQIWVPVSAGGGSASTITAAAGASTASTLGASSTAASTPTAAAGAATASTVAASSTAASAITSATGAATASTLTGSAVVAGAITAAGGVGTGQTLVGTTLAAGSAAIVAAGGVATAATLGGSSVAVAAIGVAAGVATASVMGGPGAEQVTTRLFAGGFPRREQFRKGYIIKGERYWLTEEELAVMVAQMLSEVSKGDIKQVTAGKPKPISKRTWDAIRVEARIEAVSRQFDDTDEDEDESILMML